MPMPRRLSPRQRQLNAALRQTADRFGPGIVRRLGDVSSCQLSDPAAPTGSLRLELAIGLGGYSRGQPTEILGSESSGRTVPLYDALVATQWQIGVACHE